MTQVQYGSMAATQINPSYVGSPTFQGISPDRGTTTTETTKLRPGLEAEMRGLQEGIDMRTAQLAEIAMRLSSLADSLFGGEPQSNGPSPLAQKDAPNCGGFCGSLRESLNQQGPIVASINHSLERLGV